MEAAGLVAREIKDKIRGLREKKCERMQVSPLFAVFFSPKTLEIPY